MRSRFRYLLCGLWALLLPVTLSAESDALAEIREMANAGRLEQAAERIADHVRDHPTDVQARFLKGIIDTERGETEAAIEVFTGLTVDYPELPEPYNNLAVLYAGRGEYSKARDALLQAINTHPSYATAHENLGDIYAKMAGLAYDKALELNDTNASAKSKLALVHELFSRPEEGASSPGLEVTKSDEAAAPASPPPAAVQPESPAPVPEPIAAAAPAPEPGQVPEHAAEQRVLDTLHDWAAAWAAQDVQRYLDFYGPGFVPAEGRSRASWEALRRERLRSPAYIDVEISDTDVEIAEGGRARVTFTQRYRSDTYRDQVRKLIWMSRAGDRWRIVSEGEVQ